MRAITIRPPEPGEEVAWSEPRARHGYPTGEAPPPDGTRRLLALQGDRTLARLALGEVEGLVGAAGRNGWIGWYEAIEADAGILLLRRARELLAADRVERVLAPFHGSTWDRYRLALREEGEAPPFLGEPWNPEDYPAHFAAAGFGVAAGYESREVVPPRDAAERARAASEGLEAAGVRLRTLDVTRFDEELDRIYDLSETAFAANAFYSSIERERFRSMYRAMRPLVDPELVLLAEREISEPLGFCFSYADPLAPKGHPRVVLKTLAVAPAARGAGVGGAMTTVTLGVAAERGATVVHALMASGNHSLRISAGQGGRIIRRYALYTAAGG